MSAQAYRARADALVRLADATDDYALILEMEGMARDWRHLGALADWQDAMQAALAATASAAPSAQRQS